MKLVYIAGCYRAPTEWLVHQNILLAEKHASWIMKNHQDIYPIIPHKNSQGMGGLREDDYFLKGGLEILSKCDFIYLLPNWTKSEGAKIEWSFAKERGIARLK